MKVRIEMWRHKSIDTHQLRLVLTGYCASLGVGVETCLTSDTPNPFQIMPPDYIVVEGTIASMVFRFIDTPITNGNKAQWAHIVASDSKKEAEVIGFARALVRTIDSIGG